MLDRMPYWARDLIVALFATLAAWAGSDLVPILRNQGGASALLAAVLVILVNAITPWLTRQYGAGAPRASVVDTGPQTRPPGGM